MPVSFHVFQVNGSNSSRHFHRLSYNDPDLLAFNYHLFLSSSIGWQLLHPNSCPSNLLCLALPQLAISIVTMPSYTPFPYFPIACSRRLVQRGCHRQHGALQPAEGRMEDGGPYDQEEVRCGRGCTLRCSVCSWRS